MSYRVGLIPPDAPAWMLRELQAIEQAQNQPTDFLLLSTLYSPPNKIRDGMVVKADGTAWNPGSGAGFYGYSGGAWRFLG